MKVNKLKCDLCKREYDAEWGRTLQIATGREMDASGNGYNTITKEFDLCRVCVGKAIREYAPMQKLVEPYLK